MFPRYIQAGMALHSHFSHQRPKIILNCLYLNRTKPVYCDIHGTAVYRKAKPEISSEPIKFTSSPANVPSKLKSRDVNKYQGLIVIASLSVFALYFLYLREENDLDDKLNTPLFDRVPSLEEPHLTQMIPRMKENAMDTSQAEARLKELVDKRLAKEQVDKK